MSIATLACGRLGVRVEKKIESAGSELTGVPVQVERVELKLMRGMGEIAGLTVANPAGYEAEYAFQMDLSRLNLGVFSLLLGVKTIILDELVIDSPVVNFERNAQGGSNLKEISDNVRENIDRADQKLVEEKPTTDKSPKEPIRIAVRKLVIKGVTFNARRVDGTTASGTQNTYADGRSLRSPAAWHQRYLNLSNGSLNIQPQKISTRPSCLTGFV
jgi:hypothetical protein